MMLDITLGGLLKENGRWAPQQNKASRNEEK